MNAALEELRKLQYARGEKSPFPSQLEFLKWADQVKPRLGFAPRLATAFQNAVAMVDSQRALKLPMDAAINEAIGIVNQAVLELELRVAAEQSAAARTAKLEAPKQLTLKWIWENAHWQVYATAGGALVAAFTLGAWFVEFRGSLQAAQTKVPASSLAPTASAVVSVPSSARPPASAASK
ncbi:MAG: hypothetical protein KIT60_12000 [Burkholderiaceae bacterium]|nr:hypothetical protein [Burkholderiaceae bacterium]